MATDAKETLLVPSAETPVVELHALEQIQRAEIDMQIATAKKYPRPALVSIRQRMLSFATLDEETAEGCVYTLRRRDSQTEEIKKIQGPSVRLAEIAVACYGNVRAGAQVVENDGRKVISRGVCHDLEINSLVYVEVSRRITTKDGRPFSDDMQIVTANAANAIAFRNAVFKVIPMALVKPVYEEAMKVAMGNASTLEVKRQKFFNRFAGMGVSRDRVLAVLQRESVESVDLEDLGTLIGLGTAIKDGEMTIEEAFPAPQEKEAPGKTRSKRDQILNRRKAPKPEDPPAEDPPAENPPAENQEK